MGFTKFKEISNSDKKFKENLIINRREHKISSTLTVYKFRDKDTNQMIFYIPSLELSGYGAEEKKAMKMLKFSLDDLFKRFCNIPQQQLNFELAQLGWRHNPLKKKEYSKSYVDLDGNLKDFNAVNNEVEAAILTY